METSKKATAAAVVGLVAALSLGMFAVGCSGGAGETSEGTHVSVVSDDAQDATQVAAGVATASVAPEPATNIMASWAEQFPLEYASSQMERTNAKGYSIGHSIHNLRDICERPVARDVNGDIEWTENGQMCAYAVEYDEELGRYVVPDLTDEQLAEANLKSGCLSCKTSKFTDLFELQGAEAYGHIYDADARAIVNDEYWDCAQCHTGTPSADTLSPNQIYFQALGEGLADQLDPKIAVCAQCHNSYDYRSKIKTEEDLDTFRPYRYGNDADAVFESAYEDGVNFFENDLGLPEAYVVHSNVEGFMTTTHYKMGVTCVDCHMPVVTDEESGTEYRSHFAASSPLESDEALAYCLTCHKSQGIEDADAMDEFVKGKQAEMAEGVEALEERIATFGEALAAARDAGKISGESLEAAKKDYAKAFWYRQVLVTGPYETVGSQIAMLDSTDMLAKANAAIDEGGALI